MPPRHQSPLTLDLPSRCQIASSFNEAVVRSNFFLVDRSRFGFFVIPTTFG
ncbi:hypothetical protein TIFTF001_043221 [Ficus carica]|uniref:Uncharacterized protein n=1 Tax=Ficus carica TaxID=3494 RepID=A0AA87YX33_FICCA|nr:hypothetical protein TIFTF001_043221 [Ficus carica]